MRNFPYQNQFLLKGSSRSNTNRLANLKSNPVVKAAIQRDKDIKTTQRSANFGYAAASLLIPGGFFAGIGRKAIGQAFKKAGTAGNRKGADTVGNRIKQAESLLKFKTGKTVNYDKTAIPRSVVSTSGKNNPNTFVGSYIGTFQQKKTGRILEKAVNQGPAKFFSKFSKGRNNPKTGVTAGKRKAQRFHPMDQEDMFGMSNSTSLLHNKDLVKETLKANRLAREKLKKEMSIEKNKKRAKAILAVEGKERRAERNRRVMDYIEHKMLKGHTKEEASKMAQQLIDNQG